MDIRLTINGKEVQLTKEQMNELGLMAESKKTGYERSHVGRQYYYGDSGGTHSLFVDKRDIVDNRHYDCANYYNDKNLARDNTRADTLMRNLRRYAAEHGGIPSVEDWDNAGLKKYRIVFDYSAGQPIIIMSVEWRGFGAIYFTSKSDCQEALRIYADELMWYFTKYEPMIR